MGRRRLPPYVQSSRGKYRGWAIVAGKRIYGRRHADPIVAHHEAVRLRGRAQEAPLHLVTLGQVMDLVLVQVKSTRRAGTHDWYVDQFAAITSTSLLLRETPLRQITPALLSEFIRTRQAKKVSNATLRHHRQALGRLFVIAKRAGLVEANPVKAVDWPTPEAPRMDWFEADELRALLARITVERPSDADLVLVMCYTGLRRSEMARLEAKDVDLSAGVLWVDGKVRRESVPVSMDIVPTLRRLMAARPKGALVVGGANAITNRFRSLATMLGEPRFRPHTLRHALAVMLIRDGVRIEVVQHMLRHRTIAMTLRYHHVVASELQSAASRLRLLPPAAAQGLG